MPRLGRTRFAGSLTAFAGRGANTMGAAILAAILGAAILGVAAPVIAAPAADPSAGARSCHEAAQAAEGVWGLPAGLLEAIGHVESGRFDAATGQVAAWPFSINAAGQGRYFASAEAAIAEVRALQAQGVASIDVGCFQINLLYHPDAFASLAEAFDPDANATAAAHFLSDLHARSGDWETAVGLYHSAVAERGLPYQQMVLADWHGERVSVGLGGSPGQAHRAPAGTDAYTVLLAASAAAVAVYRPSGDSPGRPAVYGAPLFRAPSSRTPVFRLAVLRPPGPRSVAGQMWRLPRVFTPDSPG
ncbi:MAG: lytic transglycosylase domain-containing protein [Acidisphaera sp.]|nr:lytic transglycosylase domain-containing protein [Acidisphaera sp.]